MKTIMNIKKNDGISWLLFRLFIKLLKIIVIAIIACVISLLLGALWEPLLIIWFIFVFWIGIMALEVV